MKAMNAALWTAQGITAVMFLFAGSVRFTMPLDEIAAMMGMPVAFIVFISVCEILGAIGVVLPGIVKVRTGLVPLAAAGLAIIMIGAVVLTLQGVGGADPVLALFPGVFGLIAAFVAYGRWQLLPHRNRSTQALILEPAA